MGIVIWLDLLLVNVVLHYDSIYLYSSLEFLILLCYIGGAGGKGTWGKPIDFYDEEGGHVKDSRDPNYDSDEAYVSDRCHDNAMFEKMLICVG